MELGLSMDNDSGYVSHCPESTLDSSSETMNKVPSFDSQDIFMSEDAHLEQPILRKKYNNFRQDSFESIVNSSQESVNTEFSGFDDSDRSELSFVIPMVQPLVFKTKDWNEYIPVQNDDSSANYLNCSSCSKQSDNSVIETSPKRSKTPLKVLSNVTNVYETNSNQSVIKNLFNDDNKENIYPSATPKKLYESHYSSNLSPDLFSDDDSLATVAPLPLRRKSIEKKKEIYCSKDVKLLKRVQSCLSGVHPPPSLTTIQMTATEMLEKIEKNKDYFWTSQDNSSSDGSSLLVSSKKEDINEKWPEILQVRYYGLHYNRNKISEDFEHLCSRYAERYIGLETQSSCVAFDSDESNSYKRKFSKPRWAAKSPGRRLSHLARRRITFSSSSLPSANSSAMLGSRTRQILVDAKKLSVLNKKSPGRRTPSKSPFKFKKTTPSSSAKKKLALKFRQMSGEFEATTSSNSSNCSIQSLKRNLFMSPSSEKSTSFSGGFLEKKSTKRALFSSPRKNSPQKMFDRKRKRSENDDENSCNKLSRSMSFDVNNITKPQTKSTFNRTFSEASLRTNSSKLEELSEAHKKKLQWVVYESLRLQNITVAHPQFKVFASVLARVTRRFLSITPSLKIEGRTTEKMFKIARHHSYAVVKGKSVDEIVNEYTRNKLKNQKPQGYIGIEEYNNMQRENSTKQSLNVLQDKVNILDNSASQKESIANKTRLVSRNRIDQIKKVISFEEKKI